MSLVGCYCCCLSVNVINWKICDTNSSVFLFCFFVELKNSRWTHSHAAVLTAQWNLKQKHLTLNSFVRRYICFKAGDKVSRELCCKKHTINLFFMCIWWIRMKFISPNYGERKKYSKKCAGNTLCLRTFTNSNRMTRIQRKKATDFHNRFNCFMNFFFAFNNQHM